MINDLLVSVVAFYIITSSENKIIMKFSIKRVKFNFFKEYYNLNRRDETIIMAQVYQLVLFRVLSHTFKKVYKFVIILLYLIAATLSKSI